MLFVGVVCFPLGWRDAAVLGKARKVGRERAKDTRGPAARGLLENCVVYLRDEGLAARCGVDDGTPQASVKVCHRKSRVVMSARGCLGTGPYIQGGASRARIPTSKAMRSAPSSVAVSLRICARGCRDAYTG